MNVQGADMGTKNFGIGYREMGRAGALVLEQARSEKHISFATEQKYTAAWKSFSDWAKTQGAKQMERVTHQMVVKYGKELAGKAEAGEIKNSTAQDQISAINSVFRYVGHTEWKSVSSTKECGIGQRSHIREDAPDALDRNIYQERLTNITSARGVAVCELARQIGLRSKEGSMLDAKKALGNALKHGEIRIDRGTKGGRPRTLYIDRPEQLKALQIASDAQGSAKAVMPPDQNLKQWMQGELRSVRELMGGIHELRSAYACERYEQITGHPAPCAGGEILNKELDRIARVLISDELGHQRIDIVAEYVGGRK